MSLRNIITENIILPLSDILLGQSVYKNFKFLQKSQWWTETELKEYQNKKLKALINHAYENVPYYTELFKKLKLTPSDIKTADDLVKLPILTKDVVRKNVKNGKLIAKNIPKNKTIIKGSSGSTGEPLQFPITKEAYSFNILAANIRGWYWMGYRLGDKYIKLSQNPRNNIKKLQDIFTRNKYLFVQQLNSENFSNIIKNIYKYKPIVLRSYPDPLLFLVNYSQKNNILLPKLKAINTTGNTLFPEARKKIENSFNCLVFNSYSCEGTATIFECPSHECYHSAMEYAVSEVIDKKENYVKRGRLITTDLWNYATPLVRYDTQDIIELSNKKCSCGRDLLAVKEIHGRDSDILITPQGKYLIVHIFTIYFEWLDSVEQFQVRQDKIDVFDILLKVNSKYSPEVEKEIYNYWEKYIDEDVKIKIHVVDDIPLAKSGKRRFLIRNKNIEIKI